MKQRYDADQRVLQETEKRVDDYHLRVSKGTMEKGLGIYTTEGIRQKGLRLQNKMQLINQKLNESISKNVAAFVVTSFVSDSYCKREHLDNQLNEIH